MAKKEQAKVLSIFDLQRMFPDEQAAIDVLAGILWQNGVECPYCNGENVKERKSRKNFYHCNACNKDFTIRTETIFHRSHIPLHKWMYAMYLILTDRHGISSLELSKKLKISQTWAWFLEQRIRYACGNMPDKILADVVESDEAHLGGKEKNKHASKKRKQGRGPVGKTHVQGIRSRDGQLIIRVVESINASTLQGTIQENVLPGTTICTDEAGAYLGLDRIPNKKYVHKRVNHSAKQYVDGMAHTNSVESVWATLKRGFYGTYHWFSREHTQLYLDEVAFRLNINEGNCQRDTIDRMESLIRGVKGRRLTWKMLTKKD